MAEETHPIRERLEVRVSGIVQGVGFRPFIYRLAHEQALAGFVGNDTGGVIIEIEGPKERVAAFLARLRSEPPPLARIDSIAVQALAPAGDAETGFRIVSSRVAGQVNTGIPADAATCSDCLHELLDPQDRRFLYPFLNCTNCGPRFTITRRIPYDRPQTSMAKFPMCPACQAEYDDPLNRRFHAQPNACYECGPHIWLVNAEGKLLSEESLATPDNSANPANPAIAQTINLLLSGHILAIKGIGGFHLSVDATNQAAVMRLRERKRRYGKPLAVMVRDLDAARAVCALTAEEEALLTTPARPIVLARRPPDSAIAEDVAPGIPWLGIFLPYAPLHHLLFADPRIHALVMTSANLSEEPIAIDNDEARARLGNIADAFLMHDREILQRCDDSVTAIVDGAPQFLRRARGFVPLGVPLPFDAPPLLAVGGHLKNVFTLASGRFAYQSQHLGDLENLTGLDFFRESLDHLMRTFEIVPQAVVHDLHPGYLSTQWAKDWAAERNLPLIAVQHHHAHIAGCIAEHGLTAPVIGLALDGTGYGSDGKIWGGEVLIATLASFERFAQLEYVPMPGGEKAIKEPWRMAFAHLRAAGFDLESAASLSGATVQEARVLERMIERRVNAPLTSSLGRLFDAVAAVVLNRRTVDYEAQAAIELEGLAIDESDRLHDLDYVPEYWGSGTCADILPDGSNIIQTRVIWEKLVDNLQRGLPKKRIASQFHSGISEALIGAAADACHKTGIQQVALSGGCLHNRRLARLLRQGLEDMGFHVFQHRNVSPGDGGLSYGQAAVASAKLQSVSESLPGLRRITSHRRTINE
ncbi:MAG: carbamoyltransferase HypF [Terracidiphilus sp.]